MTLTFRKLKDSKDDYNMLYSWCKNPNIYEWFEQRILSLEEIAKKYKRKLEDKKQELLIIQLDNKDIGLVQLYKYEKDIDNNLLNSYKNIYEYDIFIGDENCLSKGIGSEVIKLINKKIYSEHNADAIVLRPFKRNIRAIKCYQKCGFKIIDEYNDTDTIGNKETIEVMLNNRL